MALDESISELDKLESNGITAYIDPNLHKALEQFGLFHQWLRWLPVKVFELIEPTVCSGRFFHGAQQYHIFCLRDYPDNK